VAGQSSLPEEGDKLRQKEPIPGDLLACVAIALLALLLMTGPMISVFPKSGFLALALLFLLPGYALSVAIFPGQSDLKSESRIAVMLALSLATALAAALILKFASRLDASTLSLFLALLSAAAIAGAFIRRYSLPRSHRFSPGRRQNLRSSWETSLLRSPGRARFILPLILIAASVIALGYVMSPHSEPGFTEFAVEGGNSSAQAILGESRQSLVKVVNHEGRATGYTLLLLSNGRQLRSEQISLPDGQQWEKALSYILQDPGDSQKLDFLLYRDDNSAVPYHASSLWFNVSIPEDTPEETTGNLTADNESQGAQVSLDQEKTAGNVQIPVVLSSSSSGSTSSSIRKSGATVGKEESPPDDQVQEPQPSDQESSSVQEPSDIASSSTVEKALVDMNQTGTSAEDNAREEAFPSPSIPEIVPLQKIEELEANLQPVSKIEKEEKTDEKAPEGAVSQTPDNGSSAALSGASEDLAPDLSRAENDSDRTAAMDASKNASKQALEDESSQEVDNQPPQVIELSPDKPSPQHQGTTVIWTAKGSDADGDALNYKFFLDNRAVTSWTRSNTWNWFTAGSSAGEHLICVVLRDGKHADKKGFDAMLNCTFTLLTPNQTPTLSALAPDRASPQPAGANITWRASARDPEGDPLLYRFFLNGQAATDWQESDTWVWPTKGAASGSYQVKVWIRDGRHAASDSFDSSKEASFVLADSNQAPALSSFSPDRPDPQPPGTTIVWRAEASDPDGEEVMYRFLENGQAATDWSNSGSWAWNTTGLAEGDYRISVQTRDGQHAGQDGSDSTMDFTFSLAASNRTPAVSSLLPDKSGPQPQGAEVVWTAKASDPDGDPVLFRFLVDGRAQTEWSESQTWTWNSADLLQGAYRIGVQVRDGQHAGPNGYDDYRQETFVLSSKIDRQIEELMSKRGSERADYQSADISLSADNNSGIRAVLGKSKTNPEESASPRSTYRVGSSDL